MVVELSLENYLNGIFTLLFIIISLIVGIKLLIRYREYKKKELIFAGLSWIAVITPWSAAGISFVSVLLTQEIFSDEMFFFMEFFFIPIIVIFWLALYTTLKYVQYQKKILIIFIIQGIIYDVFLLYFIFTDLSVIGNKTELFDANPSLLLIIYVLVILIIILITGISFGLESLKSSSADIQTKGKFIIAAFVSFAVGAFLDTAIPQTTAAIIIVRLILITSAIEFYFGFFLPKWLKDPINKNIDV